MQVSESAENLHRLVLSNVGRMGGTSERRFASMVIDELNLQLLEAEQYGIQRRFALEKIRHDLETKYSELGEELIGLSSRDKYRAIQPPYMDQILDPEIGDELISVWVDRMIEGTLAVPQGLPAAMGQWLVRHQPEWASVHLNPDEASMNMLTNHQLFVEVLHRVELI